MKQQLFVLTDPLSRPWFLIEIINPDTPVFGEKPSWQTVMELWQDYVNDDDPVEFKEFRTICHENTIIIHNIPFRTINPF